MRVHLGCFSFMNLFCVNRCFSVMTDINVRCVIFVELQSQVDMWTHQLMVLHHFHGTYQWHLRRSLKI